MTAMFWLKRHKNSQRGAWLLRASPLLSFDLMIGLVATLWGKSVTAKAAVKCGGIVAEF
jgi:hypothetical protein